MVDISIRFLTGTRQVMFSIFLVLLIASGCKTGEKCSVAQSENTTSADAPAPKKVYVPGYYHYRNGRYTFIKGHYRPVIAKRSHWKRSLRGYTSHPDYTSIR